MQRAPLPNSQLVELLLELYSPCRQFGICDQARWAPKCGLVPRGFLGATGSLSEVRAIILCAEPGHPHYDESYPESGDRLGLLHGVLNHAYQSYTSSRDIFHKNTRWIIDRLCPEMRFDEQLRYVWMTDARLCSMDNELGRTKDKLCSSIYLKRQVELMDRAIVLPFGFKARNRLKAIGVVPEYKLHALAPPGCHFKAAKVGWEAAIAAINHARRT